MKRLLEVTSLIVRNCNAERVVDCKVLASLEQGDVWSADVSFGHRNNCNVVNEHIRSDGDMGLYFEPKLDR